jgi:hypothetical protein
MEQQEKTLHPMLANNIGAILLAVLYFLTNYVFSDAQETIQRLEDNQRQMILKISTQETKIEQLLLTVDIAARDRYTNTEAKAINQNFQRQLDAHDRRLDRIEQRLQERMAMNETL